MEPSADLESRRSRVWWARAGIIGAGVVSLALAAIPILLLVLIARQILVDLGYLPIEGCFIESCVLHDYVNLGGGAFWLLVFAMLPAVVAVLAWSGRARWSQRWGLGAVSSIPAVCGLTLAVLLVLRAGM